ncbi:MAG: hypothetical protein SFZ02_14220 [bacterium]|nr:hypothetical protein [bacterium]
MTKLWIVITICFSFIISLSAQPVLPADVPLGLDAMRAVIMVNGDGTQTIIYDWEYDMYPPQAVMSIWLIPVPSEPTSIELLPLGALDTLENSTRKRFTEPDNPCPYTGDRGIPGYDYRPVNITEAQYVHGERILGRIDDWLARGFWVDTEKLPDIQTYIDADMGFVALTVPLYGNEEGVVSPVKLTYPSELPTWYTLYSTAYAHLWVFGDTQYVSQNALHPALDYTTFHTTSETATNFYRWNYVQGGVTSTAYDKALSDLIQAGGDFWWMEYATPTAMMTHSNNDPLLTQWISQFAYMTSLRGRVGVDVPVFIPASDMPDVPRDVNLAEYVDPRVFWGCG